VGLREDIEREAAAARAAGPALTDRSVSGALRRAGALVRERRAAILGANAVDVEEAAGRLDAGTLDRLRLDDARVEALARQIETLADIPPLEREADSWTLPNGFVSANAGSPSDRRRRTSRRGRTSRSTWPDSCSRA
jgi:glutamate-5-semialdehyde dehydrogenase